MSTAKSPLSQLMVEAHRVAHHLYANWRTIPRKNPEFCKAAVMMDDGLRTVEIRWDAFESLTLEDIEDIVLAAMQLEPPEKPKGFGGQKGEILH